MNAMKKVAALLLFVVAACGGGAPAKELPHPGLPPPPPVDHHEAACGAKTLWVQPARPVAPNMGAPQGKITAFEITGAAGDARVKDALPFTVGSTFDPKQAQDAMKRVYALGDIDDVELEVLEKDGGVALRFHVVPRPALGEIFVEGSDDPSKNETLAKELRAATSGKYVPRALAAARVGFLEALGKRGYMDATMDLRSAKNEDESVDVCVVVTKGALVTIDEVRIEGLKTIKESELLAKIDTDGGKVNVAGGVVDGEGVEHAAQEFAKYLGDRGMLASRINYDVPRQGDKVTLVFHIDEGPVFRLRRYEVGGDRIADGATYQKLLKLKPKDVFNQSVALQDKAAIEAFHKGKNRPDLQLEAETNLDAKNQTIDLIFHVVDPKKPKK